MLSKGVPISIRKFRAAIRRLESDQPIDNPLVWYRTQKEHWLGWLGEYQGPGAYDRKIKTPRHAEYAYNHIVCPEMLLWIATAAGVPRKLVRAARREASKAKTMMAQSAAIRRHVPWHFLAFRLWPRIQVAKAVRLPRRSGNMRIRSTSR